MRDRRPPAPPGVPLLGNAVSFARDPFGFTTDAVDDVGDVFRVDLPVGDHYVVAHPDHAERVLVTERDAFRKTDDFALAFGDSVLAVDGEAWREQRDMLDPFFFARRIQSFLPAMRGRAQSVTASWTDGDTVALLPAMKGVTFEILASTLLGIDPDTTDEGLRSAADDLNAYFEPVTWALPDWVPTPSRRRFETAKATLRAEVESILDAAEGAAPTDGSDPGSPPALVTALAAGVNGEDSDNYPKDREAAIDQLVGLVFAGHETTALALTFTLHSLAGNPRIYRDVEAEIDAVVGDDPVEWDHLEELECLDRVIDESLRLYPPIHSLPRTTTRDVAFGEHTVPAGSEVLVSVYSMHRDERFWSAPETFDPGRWRDRDRSADAYLPFGAGPRRCLGATFARVEARIVLVELLRRFRFERGSQNDLALSPQMTTHPDGDVPVTVRRR